MGWTSVPAVAGVGVAGAEVVGAATVVAVRSGAVDPHATWGVEAGTTGSVVGGMTATMTGVAVPVSAAPAVGGTVPETAPGSAIGTGTGTGRGIAGTGTGRGTVGTGPGTGTTEGTVVGRTDPGNGMMARHDGTTAVAGTRWGGSCLGAHPLGCCPLVMRLRPLWHPPCRESGACTSVACTVLWEVVWGV